MIARLAILRYAIFLLILFVAIPLVSTSGFSQSKPFSAMLSGIYEVDFPLVKPEQITDLSNYQVLDTRELEEFEISHLPGAIWVGYDHFDISATTHLVKDQPVLVYCTVGARSQAVGKRMIELGFTRVYNFYGGLIHWANLEMPIESGGLPTDCVHTFSRAWGTWLKRGQQVY